MQVGAGQFHGSFSLGLKGEWTYSLPWNAGRAAIQSTLAALLQAPVAVGHVSLLPGSIAFNVTFGCASFLPPNLSFIFRLDGLLQGFESACGHLPASVTGVVQ